MQDEFEELINHVVKSYVAAEPSPDLPATILRRAQFEPMPQRNRWKLAFALALPVVTAVALAFVIATRLSLPPAPVVVASVPAVPHVQTDRELSPIAAEPAHAGAHMHRVRAESWVRPLPTPYTKQELALLAFVEQHPKEAAEMAKEQSRPLKPIPQQPITISHLEIKPLTIASLDQEK